jgi:hypothetical protein
VKMKPFSSFVICIWFVALCSANGLAPYVTNVRRGEEYYSVDKSVNNWQIGGTLGQSNPVNYRHNSMPPVTTECEESETTVSPNI